MSENVQILTSDTVKVNVSNSCNDVVSFEKKFNKSLTINELKVKSMTHNNFNLIILIFF